MKKLYLKKLLIVLLLTISFSIVSAQTEPAFKIRGFSATDWSAPKTLTNGNSEVTVSFMRYTFESGTNLWVDGTYYDAIDYIRLNDATNASNGSTVENNINLSSYILFEVPEGSAPVTKIELIAYAHGAGSMFDTSNLIESYSKTDNTVNAYQLPNPVTTSEPWATGYSVLGPADDIVGNGNSITHAIGRYDATFEGVDPIPANDDTDLEAIRYIRINWSSADFGGLTYMGRGRPVALFGLNIYTNDNGNPTGVTPNETIDLDIKYINGMIEVNETADIYIYSLSGALIKKTLKSTSTKIGDLPKGLYVVKAQSTETANTIVKKISL